MDGYKIADVSSNNKVKVKLTGKSRYLNISLVLHYRLYRLFNTPIRKNIVK